MLKRTIFNVWLFLCRLMSYLQFKCHVYRFWSYIYRAVWESKYKKIELPVFGSIKEIVRFIGGGGKWRRDSWKALWDAVASPQRVYTIFAGAEPVPETDLDCDDYMSFTVTVINKSIAAKAMTEVSSAKCLTVMWMENDTWKAGGHNVTLLEYNLPNVITGYAYMDYFGPSAIRTSIKDVVELVRQMYTKNCSSIGWAVSTQDLKPLIVRWGDK